MQSKKRYGDLLYDSRIRLRVPFVLHGPRYNLYTPDTLSLTRVDKNYFSRRGREHQIACMAPMHPLINPKSQGLGLPASPEALRPLNPKHQTQELEYRSSADSESPQYPANGPTWELGTPMDAMYMGDRLRMYDAFFFMELDNVPIIGSSILRWRLQEWRRAIWLREAAST